MLQVVGICLAFALILVLVNRRIALGYALLSGSLVVAVFSGLGIKAIVATYVTALLDPLTIRLVVVLGLISMLGHIMQQLGILNGLVSNLNKVLRSPKLTISVVPSIMGTLLVTGGAIMAAPLVDEVGEELGLSKSRRAAINLVFRHGWYFVYPFMPAFVLLAEAAQIDVFKLIAVQWPMTAVMITTAYFMWIRPSQIEQSTRPKPTTKDVIGLLKYSSPLWVSLSLALTLEKMSLPDLLHKAAFPASLCVGLTLAVLIGERQNKRVIEELKNGIRIPIIMSGVGIMVFKSLVGKLSVIGTMINELIAMGIPLAVVFVVLPCLTGFLSASTSSAIGITLPFLAPALALVANPLPLIMLLYASSFMGYLASPLHLCQVLTLEYFNVPIIDLYREYVLPLPLTFLTIIVTYLIIA